MTQTIRAGEVESNNLALLTNPGWLPETDVPVLQDLRARHLDLIATRETRKLDLRRLRRTFEDEDAERQRVLNEAYSTGAVAPETELTPAPARESALQEAEAHLTAATAAVVAFALDAVDRLRGGALPEDWNPHLAAGAHIVPPGGLGDELMRGIAEEEAALERKIADAKRLVAEAAETLRAFGPLKTWVIRNTNGGSGQAMLGSELEIPAPFTDGTKPRDTEVEGWWPDAEGEPETYADDTVPDDAEEGIVEMSDPWFLEQEAQR